MHLLVWLVHLKIITKSLCVNLERPLLGVWLLPVAFVHPGSFIDKSERGAAIFLNLDGERFLSRTTHAFAGFVSFVLWSISEYTIYDRIVDNHYVASGRVFIKDECEDIAYLCADFLTVLLRCVCLTCIRGTYRYICLGPLEVWSRFRLRGVTWTVPHISAFSIWAYIHRAHDRFYTQALDRIENLVLFTLQRAPRRFFCILARHKGGQ